MGVNPIMRTKKFDSEHYATLFKSKGRDFAEEYRTSFMTADQIKSEADQVKKKETPKPTEPIKEEPIEVKPSSLPKK